MPAALAAWQGAAADPAGSAAVGQCAEALDTKAADACSSFPAAPHSAAPPGASAERRTPSALPDWATRCSFLHASLATWCPEVDVAEDVAAEAVAANI